MEKHTSMNPIHAEIILFSSVFIAECFIVVPFLLVFIYRRVNSYFFVSTGRINSINKYTDDIFMNKKFRTQIADVYTLVRENGSHLLNKELYIESITSKQLTLPVCRHLRKVSKAVNPPKFDLSHL